jgi:hypothetical protein
MKMETTHVSETSTLYIHTPANYPKEDNIRFSQHGESLKTVRAVSGVIHVMAGRNVGDTDTAINLLSLCSRLLHRIQRWAGRYTQTSQLPISAVLF